MTNEQITALLAERVMGWGVGPDRFLTGDRKWMPRWRFNPTEKLDDAFRLLQQADPKEYSIHVNDAGSPVVRVRVGDCIGDATGSPLAHAITMAIARALCLEVPHSPAKRPGRNQDGK